MRVLETEGHLTKEHLAESIRCWRALLHAGMTNATTRRVAQQGCGALERGVAITPRMTGSGN